MPYIKCKERANYDDEIRSLVFKVQNLPDEKRDGVLNYIISELVVGGFEPTVLTGHNNRDMNKPEWSYHILTRCYATFLSAAAEFYRRMLAPYEQEAIEKNGDLYLYKNKHKQLR